MRHKRMSRKSKKKQRRKRRRTETKDVDKLLLREKAKKAWKKSMEKWNRFDRALDRTASRLLRDRNQNGIVTLEEVGHNYYDEWRRQRKRGKKGKRRRRR